jgi:hypothetical protein
MGIGLLGTRPWAQMVLAPALSGHGELESAGISGAVRPPATTSPNGTAPGQRVYPGSGVRDGFRRSSVVVCRSCLPWCRAGTRTDGAGCGAHLRRAGCECCHPCWSPRCVWPRW